MEIIRINDSKIKVTLNDDDMDKYDLSADAMDYDNTETRRVIWQILDEAKHRTGFDAARDRVLIQAYPGRRGGCEIYVTQLSPDKREGELRGRVSVFRPDSAEELFAVCRKIGKSGRHYESALYSEGGRYYLLVREHLQDSILQREKLSPLSFAEEYAERIQGGVFLAYIKERGECLIAHDAIETVAAFAV